MESKKSSLWLAVTALGTPFFYIPVIFYFFTINNRTAIIISAAVAVTEILCASIKLAFPTDRPIPRKRKSLYQKYDASSFPSAHTARMAALSTAILLYYPIPLLAAAAISATILVGYSKIRIRHHYIRDVIAGMAIGILAGLASAGLTNVIK